MTTERNCGEQKQQDNARIKIYLCSNMVRLNEESLTVLSLLNS